MGILHKHQPASTYYERAFFGGARVKVTVCRCGHVIHRDYTGR